MSSPGTDRLDELTDEVSRLRAEVRHSHAVSAAALSRATRVAQMVSALGPLTDPQEILDRAAGEVAEQFGADIAVFLMAPENPAGGPPRLAAHWGIPDRSLPVAIDDPPAEVRRLDPTQPLLTGPVERLGLPSWLAPIGLRHLVWGQLAVRGEHLGFLLLGRRSDEPFSPADQKELALAVSRIALAVDNGRLYSRTQEQVRRLERLHEVTAALAGTLEMDRVVSSLATTVVEEVPVAGVAVYLAGKRGLELAAEAGTFRAAPAEIADAAVRTWPGDDLLVMRVGGPPVGALLLNGRPAAGTEADSFLQHLADLGSLTIGKSVLFERVRTQAESDPLTGLPNRTLLMGRLESAVARCREHGSDLAVIFVDLDGFKSVNDTYGHDVGDQLLVAVAARLTDVAHAADTVARLGGDEFVLVRVDLGGTDEALATAEQIRKVMATPFELGEVIVVSEASVGIALASTSDYHPKVLMRDADAGMYADKVRDHHQRSELTVPTIASSGPRTRGRALASRRRSMRSNRPATARSARPPRAAPPADHLRAWCDRWSRTAARQIDGTAGEAVHRILRLAREQLEMELTWLARFVDGRQVFQAFDGDPGRFALTGETELGVDETFCVRVIDGRLPPVIPDTLADERTAQLPGTKDHHLGAYVGAPVYVGRGDLYGMLCAVSRESEPSLRHRDAKLLRMLADLLTEPLTAQLAHDAQSAAFVRKATAMLDAGGMTVDLQPILDLASGEIVSVEALARFALYPYSVEGWFAQAHQAGCGVELELDAVLKAHEFLAALPPSLTLAVNASPDVACSSALLDVVTAIDPTRMVVEITEHRRASEPSMFASAIRRLKDEGVQVAIDDAGTGYSDLRQILELQPDIVKLDRELIAGVDTDPVKVSLVQALVAFAKDTGILLVAEGISSPSIRSVLRDLQVGYGQGFALGPPEPADSLVRRLEGSALSA